MSPGIPERLRSKVVGRDLHACGDVKAGGGSYIGQEARSLRQCSFLSED